ncbi:TRAP transporter small permease [Kribbia dieselivorans]|uniref:TRAP transporter small permease n=1 Tax=Kribbia dieselivorans TaxID=331526 RepID=UPI000837EE32|nr:TRAP transporter small permease [Kribbia dieselivorans]
MTDTEVVHDPYRHGTARRTLFGYETKDHPRLDRIQNGISAICASIAGLAVVLIVILTVAEVVTRTLFNHPLGWNVGFVEQYLMVAIAFFGTVTAYRAGAHIAVATVFNAFPGPVRKAILLCVHLIVLAGLLLLVFGGGRAAAFSLSIHEAPPPGMAELPWPTWWWKSIIPVAATLGAIVVAIDAVRELTSPWSAPSTDYEPGDPNADGDPFAHNRPGAES